MTSPSPDRTSMRLRVVTPTGSVIDEAVLKVVAEGPNGAFGLLPRHIDFVSELPPGIVFYSSSDGQDHVIAINEGTLVKYGKLVLISTRDAVVGNDLDTLEAEVKNTFLQIDDHERTARAALARLEAGMIRHFLDLEESEP
ncbi:MAG: F0F1 ATP synthase subunit epsilon [Alphaproteobacteria bacterium]|nr:F0F1 ATP synthase subunit epsilon [Alphaproteobacteria bacterium]